MARMPRAMVLGYSYHMTQCGHRRLKTLFSDRDDLYYLKLLSEDKVNSGFAIWAYCLMPNHVPIVKN